MVNIPKHPNNRKCSLLDTSLQSSLRDCSVLHPYEE